jgi:hypothetical protein
MGTSYNKLSWLYASKYSIPAHLSGPDIRRCTMIQYFHGTLNRLGERITLRRVICTAWGVVGVVGEAQFLLADIKHRGVATSS